MNHNTFPAETRANYAKHFTLVEESTDETQREVIRIREETDARLVGNFAINTAFALLAGPVAMPMTQAIALEALVMTTDIADRHKDVVNQH